jgi:hypothetical protein
MFICCHGHEFKLPLPSNGCIYSFTVPIFSHYVSILKITSIQFHKNLNYYVQADRRIERQGEANMNIFAAFYECV